MVLYKLEDFAPNYQDAVGGDEIKGYDVYADRNEQKIGSVKNILVDESGRFRYLVVDTGFWIFGKQVLLPVGRSRIDQNARCVYAVGLSKEQAEDLPEFSDDLRVDYDYEERVRGVYRNRPSLEASAPLDAPAAPTPYAEPMTGAVFNQPINADYDRDTYTYEQDRSLYDLNEQDHQTLRLYEERLIATKNRVKTGEVALGKHVETETARVSVPVEKERVVIERVTPPNAGRAVSPGEANFSEREVAHMEIYEETPDIHKEAFVREEVKIRKEVERDTVEAEETIRREELDVDTKGRPVIDKNI